MKRKRQIILLDLSIVSLDIAKIGHAAKNDLTFENILRNPLEHSTKSLIRFPGIFSNIPQNILKLGTSSQIDFIEMRGYIIHQSIEL